jgi:hypothetical protein
MLKQLTLWDTTSVTSSRESADGHLHFVLPESAPSVVASQDPVRVNRSLMQGRDLGPPTLAIYGPTFADSSHSASLQSSLESKLRARMDVTGSLEYVLTWKHWDTPAFSRWLMGYPAAWDRASPNFENWREVQARIASAD